jgi:hypothetical protein
MLEHLRNVKTFAIELSESLPELELAWLVDRLRATRFVTSAVSNARGLLIEYDADDWRGVDLVDFVEDCGLHVKAVHALRRHR